VAEVGKGKGGWRERHDSFEYHSHFLSLFSSIILVIVAVPKI
jgi:hypothetical protein